MLLDSSPPPCGLKWGGGGEALKYFRAASVEVGVKTWGVGVGLENSGLSWETESCSISRESPFARRTPAYSERRYLLNGLQTSIAAPNLRATVVPYSKAVHGEPLAEPRLRNCAPRLLLQFGLRRALRSSATWPLAPSRWAKSCGTGSSASSGAGGLCAKPASPQTPALQVSDGPSGRSSVAPRAMGVSWLRRLHNPFPPARLWLART